MTASRDAVPRASTKRSALGVVEDAGRSGLGEAARLREGSAGAAHGWAAIRFPWPWRVFGMRIALPSTGELPPARRPGGWPGPLSSYQPPTQHVVVATHQIACESE